MVNFNVRKDAQELLTEIDRVIADCYRAVKTEADEPQTLSKALVEIPILLNGFGYWVAEADADVADSKDTRDHHLDTAVLHYMKTRETSKTEAESAMRITEDYRVKQLKYLEAERVAKRMKKKWDSLDKTFDGIRSRLSVVKSELERGE